MTALTRCTALAAATSIALAAVACDDSAERSRAAALAGLTGEAIRQHMEILADDAMEGRDAGSEGFRRAADYVAERFRALGLRPIDAASGYLQEIEFLSSELVPDTARLVLHGGEEEIELGFGDDFLSGGGFGAAEEAVTAPLVFAGYGIVAPAFDHDDFEGIDAAGKILVVLSGAPPGFDTDRRAFYSSSSGKQATAVERGAVGLLTVRTPVDEAVRPWSRVRSAAGTPGWRWLEENGSPHHGYPELVATALLSDSGARKLFAAAGRELSPLLEQHAAGATGSFELGISASLGRRSRQQRTSSANVVAWLPGSDPTLEDEFVVYTAHLDHLGVRASEGSADAIHNGAYDNAAGVAILLEIARAMVTLEPSPRRSVLFVASTAEEKGLRGSSYFVAHSPVPIERLVANVNIDMPYLGFPVADVEAFGAEHSTLERAVRRATAEVGMALTPDSMPEQVRFIRSDQFSFVRAGIPAVAFKAGSLSSDPALDGKALLAEFLHEHYHRPSDDLKLPYSPEGAQRFARAGLLLGLVVADDDERPRWNDGDFFGERFGRRTADDSH